MASTPVVVTVACTNCGDFIFGGERISIVAVGKYGTNTEFGPQALLCEGCTAAVEDALEDRQPAVIPFGDVPVCYADEHDEGYEHDGPSGCCAPCDDLVKD